MDARFRWHDVKRKTPAQHNPGSKESYTLARSDSGSSAPAHQEKKSKWIPAFAGMTSKEETDGAGFRLSPD
jgi:hypothetical protein